MAAAIAERRKSGPQCKLTDERRVRLLQALREGNVRRAACAYAGISEDSFARYLKASAELAEAVKDAECESERRHVGNICKAAEEGTWQASAWYLERRYEEWRKAPERVEMSGPGGGPLVIEHVNDWRGRHEEEGE